MPGRAKLMIDVRTVEQDTDIIIRKKLERFFPDTKISILVKGSPISNNTDLPIIQQFLDIQKKHAGKNISFKKGFGSHDGRFLAEKGIPIIATQPGGGNAHTQWEWVCVNELVLFHQILVDFFQMT